MIKRYFLKHGKCNNYVLGNSHFYITNFCTLLIFILKFILTKCSLL